MSREKKSQVDDMTLLRKILDNSLNPTLKEQIPKEEKALDSIRRRLAGDISETHLEKKNFLHEYDSLEPRVTVHEKEVVTPRLLKTYPSFEPSPPVPEFKFVSSSLTEMPTPSQKITFSAEELFEIEKADVIPPKFVEETPEKSLEKKTPITEEQTQINEVTPEKSLEIKTPITEEQTQIDDSNLPEWQLVQEDQLEQPPISHEKPVFDTTRDSEQRDRGITPGKIKETIDDEELSIKDKTSETPVEFVPIEKREPRGHIFSRKQDYKAKKEQKEKDKEAKRLKKLELKKLKIEKREAKREAKRIIQEQSSTQLTPEQTHGDDSDLQGWQPIQETRHTELPKSHKKISKEKRKKYGKTPQIKIPLDPYKDIICIDNKTAELLYKNGYFSIENLRDATIDDLVQIRGIKRKFAKQIKKEIEQKIKAKDALEFVPRKHQTRNKKSKIELKDTSEWESIPTKKLTKKQSSVSPCSYKGYTLYKQISGKRGGKKTTIHFFSKKKPNRGQPTQLPDGYQIAINKKTGVPYLRKKR